MNESSSRLPPTQQSLILALRDDKAEVRDAAIERFAHYYLPGLRAYTRTILHRADPAFQDDTVDEIIQSFLANRLLKADAFDEFAPTRGSFRARVLQLLKWEIGNHLRKHARQRNHQHFDEDHTIDQFVGRDDDLERQINTDFLRGLLDQLIDRVRLDCQQNGRDDIWHVFEWRILNPIIEQTEPKPYDRQFMKQIGVDSPAQAANLLVQAKRAFKRHRDHLLREIGAEPGKEDTELQDLIISVMPDKKPAPPTTQP